MSAQLDRLLEEGATQLRDTDFAAARITFAAAVRLAEKESGPDSAVLAAALMLLAKATRDNQHSPCNEVEQQVTIERRAIAIASAVLSKDEPLLAYYWYTHAFSLATSGRGDEAIRALGTAIDILALSGADDRFYCGALADLLLGAGRAREAVGYARRSLVVAEGEDIDVLGLLRLGRSLREAGAMKEARDVLQRFLDNVTDCDEELRIRVVGWIRDSVDG